MIFLQEELLAFAFYIASWLYYAEVNWAIQSYSDTVLQDWIRLPAKILIISVTNLSFATAGLRAEEKDWGSSAAESITVFDAFFWMLNYQSSQGCPETNLAWVNIPRQL